MSNILVMQKLVAYSGQLEMFSNQLETFSNLYQTINSDLQNRDLVFVCGGERLAYHQAVVLQHSIFLANLVKNFKSNEIIITLDNVNPNILRILMDCIYSGKSDKVTGEVFYEAERVHQMLGLNIYLSAESLIVKQSSGAESIEINLTEITENFTGEIQEKNKKQEKKESLIADLKPKQEIMKDHYNGNEVDNVLQPKDNERSKLEDLGDNIFSNGSVNDTLSSQINMNCSNIDSLNMDSSNIDSSTMDMLSTDKPLDPIEEQDGILKNNCLNIDCFVNMFNFKIDSSDLRQEEENLSLKRKRVPNQFENTKIQEKKNFSMLNDSNVIEEMALSDYEKIREKNIKERNAMFLSLNLNEAFDQYEKETGLITKRGSALKKSKIDILVRRRSERLESKTVGTDANPEYDLMDDEKDDPKEEEIDAPKDHSHIGLKKRACKECTKCIKKDCRKCIYCRDKGKYGGPNIKKQKCLYKEKCSQPIIDCYICKDMNSFDCAECNKRFLYVNLLEEHNQDTHQVQPVKRRSIRQKM